MHIGRFVVEGELGAGGMGAVYRVRDPASGRSYALKMLANPRGASAAALTRLRREADALTRLSHPAIVRAVETGEHEGAPYLVLELVEGAPLEEVLSRRGPLPALRAAEVTLRLAQALAQAHARGILHRDLKPQNVILRADGEPVLVDFGLAREVDAAGARLTATGAMLGTPGYMAPEQAQGLREAGPAADVFGLGATLYAALTGIPPFEGNLHQVMTALAEGRVVPPSRRREGVDPRLDAICARCLEPEPDRRYPDMHALADALEGVLSGPASRRGVLAPALAGALILGGVLTAAWIATRAPAGDRRDAASASSTRPTPDSHRPESPSPLSPTPTSPALDPLDAAWSLLEVDPAAAEQAFARLLAAQPQQAHAWLGRGEARRRLEQPEGAAADLRQALELDPDLASAHCGLGALADAAAMTRAGSEAALAHFDRALELEPDFAPALYRRGALRVWALRDPGGLADLRRAIELDPRGEGVYPRSVALRAYNFLARDLAEAGEPRQALALQERMVEAFPDHPNAYAGRAGSRARLEDYAGAAADLERSLALRVAQADPPPTEAVRAALELKISALREDAETLAAGGGTAAHWLARGVFHREQVRDTQLAEQAFERALTLNPEAKVEAACLFERSQLRRWFEEPREKAAELDRALALDPELAEAYRVRGDQRLRANDRRGALDDFDHLVGLLPDDVPALTQRGALRAALDDVDGGLADLDRALRLEPDDLNALTRRAQIHLKRGDFPRAIADLDRFLVINPDTNFGAWTDRAQARFALGDLDGAEADARGALRIHAFEPARALLERIQTAREASE